MADIALVAARVSAIDPLKADIRSYVAAAAITKGQAVAFNTAGKVVVADANGAGLQQCRGIALNAAVAGMAVDVLHEGEVAGFTVAALNADALLYLSDTAGALADAAGTMTVRVGRIVVMNDAPNYTKVVRVFTQWDANWA